LCQLLWLIHVQNWVSAVSATFDDYCKASLPSDLPHVSLGRIAERKDLLTQFSCTLNTQNHIVPSLSWDFVRNQGLPGSWG
jgi:hypothetical protein